MQRQTAAANVTRRPNTRLLNRVLRIRHVALAKMGALDVIEGIKSWRIWHVIGSAELRQRYARSRLGQFWVTLSTGILIGSLGLVWSVLWRIPAAEMMPYIAVSMVIWAFISGVIVDSTGIFVRNSRFFINQRTPFSTVIAASLYQHLLVLLHNSVIVVLFFVVFLRPIGIEASLALLGFGLALVTAFWVSYLVAMACTRYRDLRQVVSSLVQIAFFVTPVLFRSEAIPESYRHLLLWNPFAVFLSVMGDPILGEPVPLTNWLTATIISFGGLIATLPIIGYFHRRIIFWI